MKPIITLQPPPPSWNAQTILSKEGFQASLLSIVPGETHAAQISSTNETLLFVVQGEVTIRAEDINTILDKDRAVLLPKGSDCTIVASDDRPAKLLRIEVPPRQVLSPPILTVADALA